MGALEPCIPCTRLATDLTVGYRLDRQRYSLLSGKYASCDYSCGAFSRSLHAINFTAFHCKSFARLNCVHFNAFCVLFAIYLLVAAVVAVAILCQFSREKFLREQQRNGNATLYFTWRQNFTPAPKAYQSAYYMHIHTHTHTCICIPSACENWSDSCCWGNIICMLAAWSTIECIDCRMAWRPFWLSKPLDYNWISNRVT